MVRHKKIKVFGRVTGVGYRYSARSMARVYGVKGFVRNEPDNSVYIEAEGDDDALHHFIAWCRKGPGLGFVDELEVMEGTVVNYSDFIVRH